MACVTKHTKKEKINFALQAQINERSSAGLSQVFTKKSLLGMNKDEGQAKEYKPINKSINQLSFQRYNRDFMNQ